MYVQTICMPHVPCGVESHLIPTKKEDAVCVFFFCSKIRTEITLSKVL